MRHITKRENKSKQNSEEKQAAYCVSAKNEVNSTSVSKFRPLHLTKTVLQKAGSGKISDILSV